MGTARDAMFVSFKKQFDLELHNLASEAKRKNSKVKHSCDKSLKILKTVNSSEELSRHPDFVVPFTEACLSKSNKLTTIALQCLQWLSSVESIPKDRIVDVLDGLLEATQLSGDIQLKVLQIVPMFFQTYARYIHGKLLSKLLQCCSNLFQSTNKSSMVSGTASASLQQLVDEIFERLSYDWANGTDDELPLEFSVLVNNNDEIKINAYRNDANCLFANLVALMNKNDSNNSSSETSETNETNDAKTKYLLGVQDIPIDYGLEILESLFKNNKNAFLNYPDLQFLLRVKAIPLLLKAISNPKSFAITLRSYRCFGFLLQKEFLSILESEMEVIFSLLTKAMEITSDKPLWQCVLSLELFNKTTEDFDMIYSMFLTYDNVKEKKELVTNLINECINTLKSEDYWSLIAHSNSIEAMKAPIIVNDAASNKAKYLHMLDKKNAPTVESTYTIWLIISLSNTLSGNLSELAMRNINGSEMKDAKIVYNGLFDVLFEINSVLLYSTSIDTQLFHNIVRSFQKLSHAAGVLMLNDKLNQCLEFFAKAIINNTRYEETDEDNVTLNNQSIKDSNMTENESLMEKHSIRTSDKKYLAQRKFSSRHISLFRALVSLALSLGSGFETNNWRFFFNTWQWVSYYIYGPSIDFMESYYSQDVPMGPSISKNDVNSIEIGVLKVLESTTEYSDEEFQALIKSLIDSSNNAIFGENISYQPLSVSNEITFCAYNKAFYLTQMGELTSYNFKRFLTGHAGSESYWQIMNYFISLIAKRGDNSGPIRSYLTLIFTDIIKNICDEVDHEEDQDIRKSRFTVAETLIMNSLLNTITELSKLTTTKTDIYQGTINIESEIILQLLSTLKGILNEFGDLLTSSWLIVLQIINAPFDVFNKKIVFAEIDEQEDNALLHAILQKRIELIQISYDVFKLISDDFLQTLPLDTMKNVISTLVNYVTQDENLNISFSSISQFWLVGDYLRNQYKPELESKSVGAAFESLTDDQLMDLISSKDVNQHDFYIGIWIYLLKSLVSCSSDKRIEVKNGAIQTFFRIIDSHLNYLPSWELIFTMVLKPLLTIDFVEKDLNNFADFYDLALSGLINIYPTTLMAFKEDPIFSEAWLTLLSFIKRLLGVPFPSVKFIAIFNFKKLLQAMIKIDNIPINILQECFSLFSNYNIIYSDKTNQNVPNSKSEYDCVYELTTIFPYIHELMNKFSQISYNFIEGSLNLFSSASKFPLLPQYSKDKLKPSTLQDSILKNIKILDIKQTDDIALIILFHVSSLTTLMFDTRDKILSKLADKLNETALTRIPTFEALSYRAMEFLCEILSNHETFKIPASKEKYMLKTLKNILDVLQKKPLLKLNKEHNKPFWTLASESMRLISEQIFATEIHDSLSKSFQETFHQIYIDATCSPLATGMNETEDLNTEMDDSTEYTHYKSLLLRKDVIIKFEEDILKQFVISIWKNSFLYQIDDLENEILKSSDNIKDITKKMCSLDLDSLFGSTMEPKDLTKKKCRQICLDDLIKFVTLQGDEYKLLRNVTSPYLTCRVSMLLSKYIANERLIDKAPVTKLRRIELSILLNGIDIILKEILQTSSIGDYQNDVDSILMLYPLILKTIPMSHKVDGLQELVLRLSLNFTKLTTNEIVQNLQ